MNDFVVKKRDVFLSKNLINKLELSKNDFVDIENKEDFVLIEKNKENGIFRINQFNDKSFAINNAALCHYLRKSFAKESENKRTVLCFKLINNNTMKLTKEYIMSYNLERGSLKKEAFLTIQKTGVISFSALFKQIYLKDDNLKVGFEFNEENSIITLILGETEDNSLRRQGDEGLQISFSNSNLCLFIADFFKVDLKKEKSFRLKPILISDNKFRLEKMKK